MSLFHVLCAFLYFWPSTRIMCCFYNQEETWWWLKIRLFYFSAVLGLPCCVWASRCNGFCCRAQALGHAGSRHAGAAVLVQGLSCSVARGIFPDQGSNRCPLQCKAHLKPLDHKGSPGKIPCKRRTVYSVIEIRIFSTHTKVLFQVIPKTTKNEMKAPGHLRSPKTSTWNKVHPRTKPHAGWRPPPTGPLPYLWWCWQRFEGWWAALSVLWGCSTR